MARRATGRKTSTPKGRLPGRPSTAAPKTEAKAPASKKAAAAKRPSATSTGFTSKDELRAQVEKLEKVNATLRTKSREANRAAKSASSRIAELEEEVARLEKRGASQAAVARRAREPTVPHSEPPRREIDPGDAVPPEVTTEDPERADPEADRARENREEGE
jgi:hypothetical protein